MRSFLVAGVCGVLVACSAPTPGRESGARQRPGALLAAEERWSAVPDMALRRYKHTATLLPSGEVLVVTGASGEGETPSVQRYQPATRTWAHASGPRIARWLHTATPLSSGRVLLVGGQYEAGFRATAELFDVATGTSVLTGSLSGARVDHAATLLPSGQVLVTGGVGRLDYLATAELYTPRALGPGREGALERDDEVHRRHGHPAPQVRQREGGHPISTVGGAHHGEEGRVL